MTRRNVIFLAVFISVLLAPLLRAERVFKVTGVVRAPLEGSRLVVAHDEIVGFMPRMTMGFTVAEPARAQAARLRVGDRIEFTWRVDAERSMADAFRVTGQAGEPAPTQPPASSATVRRLRAGDLVPEFSLLDQEGKALTRSVFADGLTLLTFIFTRCPVPEYCPLITRRFVELQRAITQDPKLGPRARLLSVSLDPEFDRPAILKAYAEAAGADPRIWRFATGATPEIDALVKAFSVYREKNGVTLDHTLCTALIDAEGRVVELWRGNGWKNDEVLAALRAATP